MQKFLDGILTFLDKFMPCAIMKLLTKFLTVEFVTFIVIGIINTLSTAVIATLFDAITAVFVDEGSSFHTFLLHTRFTFIAGYICSLVISFFLNTHFTFHEKPTWEKALKFPISYIPNFIIQYICVWIFTSLHLSSQFAYVVAAVIGIPITFLTMRFFVYKRK